MVQGNQEPIRHKFDVLRHQYLGTRDDFAGTDEICGGAKSEKLCKGFSFISWFLDPPNFLELNAESPFNGN